MTNVGNTDDTQRLACTPVRTPVESQHSGTCLSQSYIWDSWDSYLAGNLRKGKPIFKKFRCFVILARNNRLSNHPKKTLRNPAPGKYSSLLLLSHLPFTCYASSHPLTTHHETDHWRPGPAARHLDFWILKELRR
jgi:hypothetical protein